MFTRRSVHLHFTLLLFMGAFGSAANGQQPDDLSLGVDIEYQFIIDFAATTETKLAIATRVAGRVAERIRKRLTANIGDLDPTDSRSLVLEADRYTRADGGADIEEVYIRIVVDTTNSISAQLLEITYDEIRRALSEEIADGGEKS